MRRLTALERFRYFGIVPVMAGGSDGAGEAGAGPEGGEGDGGSELYREALAGAPQELHPFITDTLKKWDAGVTPKLQEAAKLREQFGPLSEIEGLSDVPAEELSELIQFRQVLSDPEQLREWIGKVNEALGTGQLDEQSWTAMGEENGWFEGDGGQGQQGPDVESLKADILGALQEQMEPFKQFMGSQEQERGAEKAKAEIQSRMAELEGQHGELDQEQREAVYELAFAFQSDEDPIGKAFERYLKITGQAAGAAVDGKLDQPDAALSGGRVNTDAPHTSWQEGNGNVSPRQIALQRMKQSA